ncbi:hypothetical protein AVEN_194538-1 [Araneus ventricosus]|uniref:Uncharacterized protein n=1 Tax=Araneus ventricosus TaxID=182803 RepID=A0A4Y2A7W9_ARAVE|nr:hypothetical protein AVEN_194538-1 [Araneus ventricosus]
MWLKTCSATADQYLTLLREQVVPTFQEKDMLSAAIFMKDGARHQIASSIKGFLLDTFGEDRVISRGYNTMITRLEFCSFFGCVVI